MKVFVLLGALLLVAGCGSYPSMEELEDQALITGDWSAVEAREASIARRNLRKAKACAAGYMSVCETMMAKKRCSCVQNDVMAGMLYGR